MYNSLPVPSKGALRALRRIALGSSFTIAVGTGLIAEDRRRRIHTAREVRENARRIKGSRQYHGAGVAVLESLEEQLSRGVDIEAVKRLGKPGDQKYRGVGTAVLTRLEERTKYDVETESCEREGNIRQQRTASAENLVYTTSRPAFIDMANSLQVERIAISDHRHRLALLLQSSNQKFQNSPTGQEEHDQPVLAAHKRLPSSSSPVALDGEQMIVLKSKRRQRRERLLKLQLETLQIPTARSHSRDEHERLTTIVTPSNSSIQHFSEQMSKPTNSFSEDSLSSATNRHGWIAYRLTSLIYNDWDSNIVDYGTATLSNDLGSLEKSTLDDCVNLSLVCIDRGTLDSFLPVLKAISDRGCSDQKAFNDMQPEIFISRLLIRSTSPDGSLSLEYLGNLKDAASIFLTDFKREPNYSPAMRAIGLQLFESILQAGLYQRAIHIYFRLANLRDFLPSMGHVEALICASRKGNHHKHVLRTFETIFVKTKPNQSQFDFVVTEAVMSACTLKRLDKAEEITWTAASMARRLGLTICTKWLVTVLDNHWSITKDLRSTQALFIRLQNFAGNIPDMKPMYAKMVRFCVVADMASEAQKYLNILKDEGKGQLDLETLGCLILAKAMDNKWEDVVGAFTDLMGHPDGQPSSYAKVFAPIFKLYSDSHGLPEIEKFVRLFVEELEVHPNQQIFNTMVNAYAEAGEFEAITSWVSFMRPYGLEVSSVDFNSILSKYLTERVADFNRLISLCEKVRAVDETLIDSTTITILRSRAITTSDGNTTLSRLRLEGVERLNPLVARHNNVVELMNKSIRQGDYAMAVYHYRSALEAGVTMSPATVSLAVTSCLQSRSDSSIDSSVDLVVESRARGLNTTQAMKPLLLSQVKKIGNHPADMESFVTRIVATLEKRGLELPLAVITTIANSFIDSYENRKGVNFWLYMKKYNKLPDSKIDLVSLTVLLKGFLALSDTSGIEWAMGVLCHNGIMPDRRLKLLFKNTRKGLKKYLRSCPNHQNAEKLNVVVEESWNAILSIRATKLEQGRSAEEDILSLMERAASTKRLDSQGPKNRRSRSDMKKPVLTE